MINFVVLIGRLTRDPDLKYLSDGTAVTSFNLAVNRSFTNQEGKREADFINCVIWRKKAEKFAEFLHKGSLVAIVGRNQTRSYEDEKGVKRYITEVVCSEFQVLESKEINERRGNQTPGQNIPNDGEIPYFNYDENDYFGSL